MAGSAQKLREASTGSIGRTWPIGRVEGIKIHFVFGAVRVKLTV